MPIYVSCGMKPENAEIFSKIKQSDWLKFFEIVRSHCSLVGTDSFDYDTTFCDDCCFYLGKVKGCMLVRGTSSSIAEKWDDDDIYKLSKSFSHFSTIPSLTKRRSGR